MMIWGVGGPQLVPHDTESRWSLGQLGAWSLLLFQSDTEKKTPGKDSDQKKADVFKLVLAILVNWNIYKKNPSVG